MNLLDLLVNIGVNDEASDAVEKVSGNIVGRLGKAASTAAKALAGLWVTKKVVEFGKASFEAYANFEQMAGGIKQLMGQGEQSFDEYRKSMEYTGLSVDELRKKYDSLGRAETKMFDNASKAWRNAQMDTTQYLEIGTMFSGRLQRELGDSEKAADQINVLISSIADNYNRYNADINAQIMAAQSLARGSYRMLDTFTANQYSEGKASFQQFMKDAEDYAKQMSKLSFDEYAASMSKTGLSVDELKERYDRLSESTELSGESFSDIITALSIIQEKSGTAGVSQSEALNTLQGSMTAAKAAWENLVLEFGKPDADLSARVSDMMTALFGEVEEETGKRAGGVINNVRAEIATIVTNIVTAIPQVIAGVMDFLPDEVASRLQAVIDVASNIWNKLTSVINVDAIAEKVGIFADGIGSFFDSLGSTIDFGYINVAIDTVSSIVQQAWGFVEQNIIPHLPELGEMVGNVVNFVMSLATSVLNVVDSLAPFLPAVLGAVAAVKGFTIIQTIIGFVSTLGGMIATAGTIISTFGGVLGTAAAIFGGWPIIIAGVVGAVVGFIATNEDARKKIKEIWEAVKNFFSDAIDGVSQYLSDLSDSVSEQTEIVSGQIKDAFDKIAGFFSGIGEFIADPMGTIDRYLNGMGGSFEDAADSADSSMNRVEKSVDDGKQSVQNYNSVKLGDKNAKATVTGNAQDGKAKTSVENTGKAVKNLSGKDIKVTASGNIVNGIAKSEISKTKGIIDKLTDKAITITTHQKTVVSGPTKAPQAHGGIRKHARGDIMVANRYTKGVPLDIVGEAGPEAIVPLTSRYGHEFARIMGMEAGKYIGGHMGGGNSYNLYYSGEQSALDMFDDLTFRMQVLEAMGD